MPVSYLSKNHITAALQHAWDIDPTQGNAVQLLQNGSETFPAMLQAIEEAQHSITFENYRFWSDATGWKFARAMAERAKAGVAVHIVYDAYGSSSASDDFWRYLTEAGAQIRAFHGLFDSAHSLLVRDHRKLMVVDGRIGFIGGHCISNHWTDRGDEHQEWRDCHCRVEGPAVAAMQDVFSESWQGAGGNPLSKSDPQYYPKLEPVGSLEVMTIASSDRRKLSKMYRTAFEHARERIWIANAYFVPDPQTKEVLKAAAQRGIEVCLLLPARGDMKIVVPAARSSYTELLEAGCAIYEYQPTVMHAKIAMIDRCWATIGSCNFDHWSLDINFEANVTVSDADFVREMEATFIKDLEQCERIDLHEWQNRPLTEKLKEWAVGTIRSKL